MERLVDPLTTIDAKLWADEFMKVNAAVRSLTERGDGE
mgnify:FL=1